MKKTTVFYLFALTIATVSCTSETTEKEVLTTLEESSEDKLTCVNLLTDYDNWAGKTVTITAYSWGNQETLDGKIQVAVAEFKLEGMASPNVVLDMEDKAVAEKIKKDDQITFTATVGPRDYGVIHLTNATIK